MPAVPRIAFATLTALALLVGASASAAKPAFGIRSSLDGKTVLPHRIHWVARPHLPEAQIESVDFLIDGKLVWIEHNPPYVYSEDEDGVHLGYLVTSWLAPGRHRFAVRAIAKDGRKATATVTARVTAPLDLPTGLAGRWQRTITDTSGAPAPGTPGNPTNNYFPAGTYTMVIDPRQIQMRFPGTFRRPASDSTGEGWVLDSDYTVSSSTLRATGPVIFEPYRGQAEGGWWCWQDGPSGAYDWSISADTLTLAPRGGADPCANRGFIWAGAWKRTG
jgi:hypothetical protein